MAEQSYQAVLAVIGEGGTVTEVAKQWNVDRSTPAVAELLDPDAESATFPRRVPMSRLMSCTAYQAPHGTEPEAVRIPRFRDGRLRSTTGSPPVRSIHGTAEPLS